MSLEYHFGFTGRQDGMSDAQIDLLEWALNRLLINEDGPVRHVAHHGDCIGADAEFHRFVRLCGANVHLHPPDDSSKRAFCDYDILVLPKPYMERNQEIVDWSMVLFAAPGQMHEVTRSGTWATVRRARKKSIPIFIIYPDGTKSLENFNNAQANPRQ